MFNPITTLNVTAGAAPATGPTGNHVVVYDENQNPLPSADITWSGLPTAPGGLMITPDATGFFFTAPASAPAETVAAVATYTVNGVTGTLTVVVMVAAVTALQFSQE